MQFTSSALIAIALATIAVASPAGPEDGGSTYSNSCTSVNQHCCESTHTNTGDQKRDLGLLGDILGDLDLGGILKLDGLIGVNCVNALGKQCNAETLCCSGNSFQGGLIATNCAPLIGL